MMRPGWGMGWTAMLGGTLLFLLFLVVLIVLVGLLIWAIARSGPRYGAHTHRPPPPEDPLEAARRRYARGEITRDEFLTLRDDLQK